MQFREVFDSLPFRYIVKYVVVLSAAVFLLVGLVYVYYSYTSFAKLGEEVLEELESLQIIYRGQSLAGVDQYIEDQRANFAVDHFHYLVTDAAGQKVAGDLPLTPRYQEFDDGWLGFEVALQSRGEEIEVDFLAHPMDLGDGYEAIVATNYADIVSRTQLVFQMLFRVMIVTVALGAIGGYFSAASTLNRVERLNKEISRIIRSDPHQRLDLSEDKGYVRGLGQIVNEMLEEMESLMQGVRRVSDNIAHDLRTPLTRMRNDLSQLKAAVASPHAERVDRLTDECDELLASFNALLRISTLEAGSGIAGGVDVNLNALLQDVVELYEPLAAEAELSLTLETQTMGTCTGEVDLLFQMLTNLVDNAIKYTPAGGSVRLRLMAEPSGSEFGHSVTIEDSGPGIPTVERKNVFRRFYRVESSRSEQRGHGLGLSLVQAIAQYHRGDVVLSSSNPGLRVRVRLP
ncbi:MAG: sensor histidine kinase [Halioglobus sp.]